MAVIRPIVGEDREAVATLWRGLFDAHADAEPTLGGWRANGAVLDATIGAWIQDILDGREGFCRVAADGPETLGFVAGFVRDQPWLDPPRRGVIGALVVAPRVRRGGIGRALLTAAEAWFVQEGVTIVEAGIGIANTAARRFWKRAGYGDVRHIAARSLGT
jgi:ribosomal protein S18 acetylase RimI-like enzyme